MTGLTLQRDRAAHGFRETRTDGQPQSNSGIPVCIRRRDLPERLENAFPILFWYALPGIMDTEHQTDFLLGY